MSMPRRYWLAHDCPNCGAKDERYSFSSGSWGGARMGSSTWNHSFSCCSEECGQAFAAKHRELEKTKAGRKELAALWEKLAGQSDSRLSGEPYYGYGAEQLLKYRSFE
jgi:hypothetical protein